VEWIFIVLIQHGPSWLAWILQFNFLFIFPVSAAAANSSFLIQPPGIERAAKKAQRTKVWTEAGSLHPGRLNFHNGMFITEKERRPSLGREYIGILAFHFCFSTNHWQKTPPDQ
jgi:hypothetical protein